MFVCAMLLCFQDLTVHGTLRGIMRQGDIAAKVRVGDVLQEPNVYGLGAAAKLKGEILIMDGKALLSRQNDDGTVVTVPADEEQAALLVSAPVQLWREVPLPEEVTNEAELSAFLDGFARGLGGPEPFPFLLRGKVAELDWHIINWPEGDTEHTHQKHKQAGAQGRLEAAPVQMLGFYSPGPPGVFTHHRLKIHIHVQTKDFVAHVDRLNLGRELTLWVPHQKRD